MLSPLQVEQTKRSGLPENESLHAECLSLKAETDKSLVSLAAKIPAKSKLKQDFTKERCQSKKKEIS